MTDGDAPDYLQDVEYPSFYQACQLPALLSYVSSDAHPPGPSFNYLDVACGPGRTLLVMAAAHPRARFVGLDASIAHIDAGRAAAARAQLANIEFVHAPVERACEVLGAARFEFISMVGAYSWLPDPARTAVHALATQRLAVGGKLLLHYSSLPGAAQHHALFGLLQAMGTSAPAAGSEAAMRISLAAALALRDGGARFFSEQPQAARRLEAMREQPLAYLAHEALNRHFRPAAHGQLTATLSTCGLTFAGQALPVLNDPRLALPPGLAQQVVSLPAGVAREIALDFALNLGARHDVFVRERAEAATGGELQHWAFACITPRALLPATHRLPSGQSLDLRSPPWRAVLDRLAGGVLPFDAIVDARVDSATAGSALRLLVAAGLVQPAVAASSRAAAAEAGERLLQALTPARLNVTGAELAVPESGVVVTMNGLDLACLSALLHQPGPRAQRWLGQYVKGLGFDLPVPGISNPTPAQRRAFLAGRLEVVREHWLPKLSALGLVQ